MSNLKNIAERVKALKQESREIVLKHLAVLACNRSETSHSKSAVPSNGVINEAEFWPSTGEYEIMDELLYYALTSDEVRNTAYRSALQRKVKGKIALDLGTGSDAILARFCVEAGAERVYALEVCPNACEVARNKVRQLGLINKITVVEGDATVVDLPEQVDVCVSEHIGSIGSSENSEGLMACARRFLKGDGVLVPSHCITHIAAVTLPANLAESPVMSEVGAYYVSKIFAKYGAPFDLRLCIRGFPSTDIVSDVAVFEDLDYGKGLGYHYTTPLRFQINRDATLYGFLLWVEVRCDELATFNVLNYSGAWSPAFFPVFYPGIPVERGDVIDAVASSQTVEHAGPKLGIMGTRNDAGPDYYLEGVLKRGRSERHFVYASPHRADHFRGTPFYERLFPEGRLAVRAPKSARLSRI